MRHRENFVNAVIKRFREDDLASLVLFYEREVLKRRRFREFCSMLYRRMRSLGVSKNKRAYLFFAVVLFRLQDFP
jgi:hypothetical protein